MQKKTTSLTLAFGMLFMFASIPALSQQFPEFEIPKNEHAQKNIFSTSNHDIVFTENGGQFDKSVLYRTTTAIANIYIKNNGIDFSVAREKKALSIARAETPLERKKRIPQHEFLLWNLSFIGANPQITHKAYEPTGAPSHHYTGAKHVVAHNYKTLALMNMYDGIDVHYYSYLNNLKYDIILKPGSDLHDLTLNYNGIENLAVNSKGQLSVKTAWGEFIEETPFSYQVINGIKKSIDVSFKILDPKKGFFTFSVNEEYDKSIDLIIDPTLYWSTFDGGLSDDYIYGLATDQENNVIVVGWTSGQSFPVTHGLYDDTYNGGSYDVFITKYNPNGVKLWSAFLGGTDTDLAYAVVCDNNNNIYITGRTNSTDFPVSVNAVQVTNKGGDDIFITKVDKDGGMQWSTYFGGSIHETAEGIVVTPDNQIVITGYTRSFDFPVSSQAYQKIIGGGVTEWDVIVASFDMAGNNLWSTYLGGSGEDRGEGINVDSKGNIIITGETMSNDFPTKNAFQNNNAGSFDIIITKITPDGKKLIWSTYYGGSGFDISAESVGIDSHDNIVLSGFNGFNSSSVQDFPITFEQFSAPFRGYDIFVMKFDTNGLRLWSTYYGGLHGGNSGCWSLAISDCDKIWIAITNTSDPGVLQPVTANAFTSVPYGTTFNDDVIIVSLTSDGYLDFGSYYGGNSDDQAWGIAVDRDNNIVVAGFTKSMQFPIKNASQPFYFDQNDGFIFKFKPDKGLTPDVNIQNLCDQKASAKLTGYSGNSITWNWDDGTSTSNELSPTHTYDNAGAYTISVDITGNCVNSPIEKKITINPKPTAAFSWLPDCHNGIDFKFEGQNSTNLFWEFSQDESSTETDPYYIFSTIEKYTVKLTAYNGTCFDKVSQDVLPKSLPKPTLPPLAFLCDEDQLVLNVETPSATYLWQDGSSSGTYLVKQPGSYAVTVQNDCGKISENVSVSIGQKPTINLGDDFFFCNEADVELDASYPNATYLWQDGSAGPKMLVTAPGTYTVQINTSCGDASDAINVVSCDFFIPNVVTDDANGINDFFYLKGIPAGSAKLTIINRWGEVVFHSDHYENNWNANRNSPGTYYYTLSFTGKTFKGWIDVMK